MVAVMHASPPEAGRRPLSTGAAAVVAGVHATTIWRAIISGELETRRLGRHGHYRVAPDALDAWLLRTHEETVR
jgi:excisionase family DNA binding protein